MFDSLHDILQNQWSSLKSEYTDFQLATLLPFVLLVSSYVVCNLPFLIIDHWELPWFKKYKIQPGTYPTWAQTGKTLSTLAFSYFCIMLPLSCCAYFVYDFMGMDMGLKIPSGWTIFGNLAVCMLIEDFTHYWAHRWLHLPWPMEHIHSKHHEWRAPFGLAASYAHPIETVLLGLCTFAGPILLRPHLLVVNLWILLRQLMAVETHCGYDFPFSPNRLVPFFFGGADYHDYHHQTYQGPYASNLRIWDTLFGTDQQYKAFRAKQRQREESSKAE